MSKPPRTPGGRPPGNRPPAGRSPTARPPGNRPDRPTGDRPQRPSADRPARPTGDRPARPFADRAPRAFDDRAPRSTDDRPARPQRPGPARRPGGEEMLATNMRELRQHIPGGRPPRLPRGKVPAADPGALPSGRRNRGERRIVEARSSTGGAIEPQRIAKLLARAGVGSRRDIERMIGEGRISVHGKVLESPALVISSLEGVLVNGEPVNAIEATRLFMFHKPNGFLTTARDPGGRPTIFDVLPTGLPRLVPVGRLDMNTEGLLLMTTDGALKRQLELPVNAVSRRYRVRAYGDISQAALESLIDGITIDDMRYGPIDAELEIRTGRNLWLAMRLTEGKNREIRRVLEFLGLQVSRLIRTAYGPFELGDLPVRGVVEVPPDAIARLKKSFGKSERD